MNSGAETQSWDHVRAIRGERLLRRLHRVLPLGRKYHPLLSVLNGRHGLLAIPFDNWHLVQPASWAKQITTQLLSGIDVVPEFRLLAPLVRQLASGCLIDVGANIGLYTLLLRSVSALPIIAYEPQPFLFKLLECNVDFNRITNVDARNFACGAKHGEVPFTIGINGSVAAGVKASGTTAGDVDWESEAQVTQRGETVINVQLTTLDEDLAGVPSISLLKIDCEGFEFDVLQGALLLIERHSPLLFLEIHPTLLGRFGRAAEEVLELLRPDYDFDFWCFDQIRLPSKLGRSLAKFRRPKGLRYADAAAMLLAANGDPRPAQIYLIGRPKPRVGVT